MHIASDGSSAPVLQGADVDYEKLRFEAYRSPKKRSRVILVPGFDMVICLHHESYVRMHRHPRYEAYHVIEGVLLVAYMDVMERHTARNPYVLLPPLTWHAPRTDAGFVIYREFYCGPFEKERDVEYAPWTQAEAA